MRYSLKSSWLVVFVLSLGVMSSIAADGKLKERADQVLKDTDNVQAAKSVGVVFEYAEELERSGQTNAAVSYFERGLTLSPWRLNQQMACARLLYSIGKTNAALDKARMAFQRAETDDLIGQSSMMLGLPWVSTLPNESWPQKGPSLAIVPLGDVDVWLLRSLQTNLSSALKIPVVFKTPSVRVPPAKRDPLKMLADRCREPLKNPLIIVEAQKVARTLSLEGSFREDDEAVIKVFRELQRRECEERKDMNALLNFDGELAWIRRLGKQWEAENLLKEVDTALAGERMAGNAFLAVTKQDLFSGSSRFVFGFGNSANASAIVSSLRFSAALMDQTPDRDRLSKRVLKQALSSVGFAFGVPRCSSPICARSYPNNLEEHDAKGTELCEACRLGFEKALKPK